MTQLFAPFPYAGGKRRIAADLWERLGDPTVYIEPFAGSIACLLLRPGGAGDREIVCDKDGQIANIPVIDPRPTVDATNTSGRGVSHQRTNIPCHDKRPTVDATNTSGRGVSHQRENIPIRDLRPVVMNSNTSGMGAVSYTHLTLPTIYSV